MFEKFIKDIKDNKLKVHNILVLSNDKSIFEYNFTPLARHNIYSYVKSFLGVLVGISIEEGYLSLKDNVYNVLQDELIKYANPNKSLLWKQVTVQRLLTIICKTNIRRCCCIKII